MKGRAALGEVRGRQTVTVLPITFPHCSGTFFTTLSCSPILGKKVILSSPPSSFTMVGSKRAADKGLGESSRCPGQSAARWVIGWGVGPEFPYSSSLSMDSDSFLRWTDMEEDCDAACRKLEELSCRFAAFVVRYNAIYGDMLRVIILTWMLGGAAVEGLRSIPAQVCWVVRFGTCRGAAVALTVAQL